MTEINYAEVVPKIDAILARGLSNGVGQRDGQMCIEAAICAALDMPHGDDPWCVTKSVRSFHVALNDAYWSSPEARAKGLRNLGIAQLGSKGVVSDEEFAAKITLSTINVLIPELFRDLFPDDQQLLKHADNCENAKDLAAARAAADAARAAARLAADAAYAADAAADAADAAAYAAADAAYAAADAARAAARAAADAAYAAADAAYAADAAAAAYAAKDKYLLLSASIAFDVLVELKSPGVAYV